MMIFPNRVEAGRRLATLLVPHAGENAIVLGLPRGGVIVAAEVAAALDAPLDVWVVRKIGAPRQPELGLGAIAEGSGVFVDTALASLLGVDERELAALVAREKVELDRRVRAYRRGRPPPRIQGRTVILVDDGLATGGTARAAIQALQAQRPARLVFAVPVAATDSIERLGDQVDEIVCAQSIADLRSIGEWYVDFAQTSDDEVTALLDRAREPRRVSPKKRTTHDHPVIVRTGSVALTGDLAVPEGATGLVVFAHGSGSSRRSPRNQQVAAALRADGLATLLFDLLTPNEEGDDALTGALRFDIGLLGARLVGVTDWLQNQAETRDLSLGYFGASTGAAAALVAAATRKDAARAVVSRGGRPDLAGPYLARVEAPTLLIVGGLDREVLALNRSAMARLGGPAQLAIVPGATHLFEEAGALDAVARLASDWFVRHLTARAPQEAA
jgi:putative phosphoribosyl transferase